MSLLAKHNIIQIKPEHKWGGCLAVVDEVKGYGCRAYVLMPRGEGQRPAPAYINLNNSDFEGVGAKLIYEPEGE